MKKERLYYVDWLRSLVILSLVPYHAALTYTGLGDIYIKLPIKGLRLIPFLTMTAPLDSCFMALLFFISGISSFYSLRSGSKDSYLKGRRRKLLYPFLAGLIFMCPIQAYFKALNDGFSGNYFNFLPQFFSEKIVYYLGYAHLWFLFYLFIFSLLFATLFKNWLLNKEKADRLIVFLCRGNNILLPIGFIIVVEILLRPFFNGPQTFIMDWTNDIVYGSLFIYGFVYAMDTRLQERLKSLMPISAAVVAISIPALICIYYSFAMNPVVSISRTVIWVAFKGFYECSIIIFLMYIGNKYMNRKSKAILYLSKASFTFYFIHFIPVSALTYLFIRLNMNIYIKYLAVIGLSYVFMALVFELIVNRLWKKHTNNNE